MKDRHTVFNTSHCIGLSSCFNCITSRYLKESLNRAYCVDFKIDFDLSECYDLVFIRLTCLKKRKQIYLFYTVLTYPGASSVLSFLKNICRKHIIPHMPMERTLGRMKNNRNRVTLSCNTPLILNPFILCFA